MKCGPGESVSRNPTVISFERHSARHGCCRKAPNEEDHAPRTSVSTGTLNHVQIGRRPGLFVPPITHRADASGTCYTVPRA